MRVAFIVLLLCGISYADPPKVDVLFPAGGRSGTDFEVTAGGTFDPWPVKVWCSDDRLSFEAVADKKGTFRVSITAEAEPGPRLLRVFNSDGSAAPRIFMVGELPEISETEPNNTLSEAQEIDVSSLPQVVNGKLNPGGEVDSFTVDLAAGGTLFATVDAYSLDSPIDPLLHIRDQSGTRVAFNHDATDIGLDPRLAFTAPEPGRFTLRLFGFTYPPTSSHRLGGSSKAVYRLSLLNTIPPPSQPMPEPEAQTIPFVVAGQIERPGDVDAYSFKAKKGAKLVFQVQAATLGSLLDPQLRILNSDGKELAKADDIDAKTNHDTSLVWTAPSDDQYTASITDVAGKGAPDYAYQFTASLQKPYFEASTDTHSVTLKSGETTELSIKVKRHFGYTDPLSASAKNLPAGITAAAVDVPEKGDTKLVFNAAADAKPANQPISIWVGEQRVQISIKGASTDAGDLAINESPWLWLTVR